ncbi:hypothetical protein B0A55_11619 [Friedmanniomyces simplex]|uniref:Uncharacterized protein n=1 Tax=Friedmanniomyces simplex TaxID=329884 RepID=A0A4V5ND78_9PEZI|nr:hypothetical protein B0A55_11619 [Friedmanniomyces simplex]
MAQLSRSPIVDLPSEPKDHLTALPPELKHVIFEHLLPSHRPDKELQTEVLHWLKCHAAITGYKKSYDTQQGRRHLTGKQGLLFWVKRRCVFCGKQTQRSAILANGLRCCMSCDKEQWPEKITKTKAKEEFDLRDHHLLPRHHLLHLPHATVPKLGTPSGITKPRYGTFRVANVMTTMFLLSDVRRLAEKIHGDLDTHLKRRKLEAEDRKQKKELRMEAKRNSDLEWMKMHEPFRYAKETGGSIDEAGRELQALMTQAGLTLEDVKLGGQALRCYFGL